MKCYETLGLMVCDRPKGHEGAHRDDWILAGAVEFTKAEPDPDVSGSEER